MVRSFHTVTGTENVYAPVRSHAQDLMVRIEISGGTRKRTGKILVPSPVLTNMCRPPSTICPAAKRSP